MNKPKVLCVDDERNVLDGLALHLHRAYDVVLATSGQEGLATLAKDGPFAVVLSDMRMPGMDGSAFLAKARLAEPDTVRMLLTGYADIQSAIAVVNEGQIFRFLTKPCPPDQLLLAFKGAVDQNRLITAERVLLEQTLHGSIKALTDILALTNPIAFGRATRILRNVSELAEHLHLPERWQVEVAAMLSQLGSVALSEETVRKYYYGEALNAEELESVARMSTITERLLANIPRLESVREILVLYRTPFESVNGTGGTNHGMEIGTTLLHTAVGKEFPLGARILKIAVDFDEIESRGVSPQFALDTMVGRQGCYDPDLLRLFIGIKNTGEAEQEIKEVSLKSLLVGMILAEDMRAKTGVLLAARGYQITESFIEKSRNFRPGYINEPLRIVVKSSIPR